MFDAQDAEVTGFVELDTSCELLPVEGLPCLSL